METKLKNAFKKTPDRFRYAVKSAVSEAEETVPQRRHVSKGMRAVIASALILALIPTAIFGASKIISGMNAEKEGNYGVKITATTSENANYPEYVKMHVTVPKGFAEVPHTDGLKYYNLSAEHPYTDGFSLEPFRPANGVADIANYAEDYEETVVAGRTAYKIIPAENYGGFDRIYIYYEDVNVMLLVYYEDVTEQQLNDFIAGISFTEGTAKDHTDIGTPVDDSDKDIPPAEPIYTITNDYIEKPLDTEFTFADFGEDGNLADHPAISCKASDVRVLDSISGLDQNGFNDLYMFDEIADESGNLTPYTREVWQYGDGINTNDKLISSEEVDRKLVLIDLEYTNLTGENRTVYIPWRLSAMTKNADGSFKQSESIDEDKNIVADTFASTEIYYMSDHGEGKAFYAPTLSANEAKTITIGFIADADKLDELYLSCCPSADSVYSPSYPTENPYTYFLVKVL